jgi:hypothetical protein
VNPFEQQVEQDLAWREAEMGCLKLLLASARPGSDRHRALLRACSAMLYAHYEGFCKFCWTLLLDAIQASAHIRRELAEPIAKRAMAPVFRQLRGDTSDTNLWRFASSQFENELDEKASFPDEVDTGSNLWPGLAQRINGSVGLNCPLFDTHAAELGQLVGRRNKIAHGEKLEIADLKQFRSFEHAAWVVMHELAIAVVECLADKSYLRSIPATVSTPP